MSSIESYGKTKKAFLLFFVSLLLLFIVVATIELLSFYFLKKVNPPHVKNISLTEFVLSRPLAFEGAEDFEDVRRGWAGETNCPANRIVNDSTTGFPYFELPNVACDGPENIKDGLRVTTDQPGKAAHRVILFGGSTMWGTGSADRNTIPSVLQRQIREVSKNYIVYNYGFSTVTAFQQLAKLKTLSINRGDIVIFYDGGNDQWQGVVNGNPKGSIIGYNEEKLARVVLNRVKFFLSTNSHFYRVLAWFKNKNGLTNAINCQTVSEAELYVRMENAFSVYKESIEEAREYVEASGGSFFHFLQPTLVSRRPYSEYERNLMASMPAEAACGLDIIEKAGRYYSERYVEVKNAINATDLSQVLAPQKTGKEYFFDWIHVSSNANKDIATQMLVAIKPVLERE